LQCLEARGPRRVQTIEQIAETLRRTAGVRPDDVFVRDESDGAARLYYGTYYRKTDPKTGRRSEPEQMRRDIGLLRDLASEKGQRFFVQVFPVRMPMPDVGNPEWDLRRANGTYSLQVGVFEPTDEFWEYKQAAVDFCAYLRKQGREAFYFHGTGSSSVTVGLFGPDALVTKPDGKTYYAPQVLALQRDELLTYNLLNRAIYRVRQPSGVSAPVESRLVEVPRRE